MTQPARQEHPEGRQHAKDPRLLVRRLHDDDGKADILAVLRGHELHDHALLGGRAGRRVAAKVPVAVFRFDLALRRSMGGGEKQQNEQQDEAMQGCLRKRSAASLCECGRRLDEALAERPGVSRKGR